MLTDVTIPWSVLSQRVFLNSVLPLSRIQKGTVHFQELVCVSTLTFFFIIYRLNLLVIEVSGLKYEFPSYSLAKCIVEYYETSFKFEERACLIVKFGLHCWKKKIKPC